MKQEQTFFVGVQAVSFNKEITNKAVLEMFSDITMLHGFRVGHTSTTGISPVSWIVLNWKMKIYKRARLFDNLRIATWVRGYSRLRAEREYVAYDETGELIARATAIWVARKGASTVFCRLTPELMEPFQPETEEPSFPGFTFRNFMEYDLTPEACREVGLYPAMLDYNAHIHNSEYLNLAEQILPGDVDRTRITDVEVYYKQELQDEQEVLLEYAFQEGCHKIAVRGVKDRVLHAVVELYENR